MRTLVLQHLGHAELGVLWVAHLLPQGPAQVSQPGVELHEAAELDLGGFDPDAPAAVLHVLLHHALVVAAASLNLLRKLAFAAAALRLVVPA
jgi:hypothetical protein